MTIQGLIGRKVGMTTLYWEDGRVDGVTLVEVGPCIVTQIRTQARDGYEAVQVGFQETRRVNKPTAGHLERSGGRYRHLQEFQVDELSDFEVGQSLGANVFHAGDKVSVRGVSKGRGFAGGVKRYGFKGGPKTHGQSDRHRSVGSIGAGTSPGRVWKGTRMAGHMGARNVTSSGLKIALVDDARNILALTGSVPGPKNGIVRVQLQERNESEAPTPLFTVLPTDAVEDQPTEDETVDEIAVDEEVPADEAPASETPDEEPEPEAETEVNAPASEAPEEPETEAEAEVDASADEEISDDDSEAEAEEEPPADDDTSDDGEKASS